MSTTSQLRTRASSVEILQSRCCRSLPILHAGTTSNACHEDSSYLMPGHEQLEHSKSFAVCFRVLSHRLDWVNRVQCFGVQRDGRVCQSIIEEDLAGKWLPNSGTRCKPCQGDHYTRTFARHGLLSHVVGWGNSGCLGYCEQLASCLPFFVVVG